MGTTYGSSGPTQGVLPKQQPTGIGSILPTVKGSLASVVNPPVSALPKVGGLLAKPVANQVASGGLKAPSIATASAPKNSSLDPAGTGNNVTYQGVIKSPMVSPSTSVAPQATMATQPSNPTPNPITLATNPNPTNAFSTNIQNLTDRGAGKETPGVDKAREDLKNFQTQYANQVGANSAAPIPLEFSQGRNQVLANQYNSALPAYQGAVSNSLTSQGQQIGAAGTAGGLSQPVGQFGMLTNPQTGQPLNTGIFQSAIQQAQQLVSSGTPVNDPSVQALLSPFGFVGPLAFNQAMQNSQSGQWNPAAQSAVTNQNIAQGVDTQQQAYSLNLGLQQLKTLQPVITNFLSTSGINPTTSPLYNQPINNYIQKLGNPAAVTQYQYMLNDLQKFASQMLSAGAGGTPTGVQTATELMNPGLLSMAQIQSALSTLDTLGTNQVSVLQQQSQASLGGQPQQYAGNLATPSSATPVASPSNSQAFGKQITNPGAQALVGTGLSAWEQLTSIPAAIGALLGHIFN